MKTIAQAFTLQEAPLAQIEGNVRDAIILHLSALSRFLNMRSSLTDEHIEFIADTMLSDENYKWLKPADLKIFFDRLKSGFYGDFYGNLNSISFFNSLNKYMIERNGEIERLRMKEAQEHRRDPADTKLPYYIDENGNLHWTDSELERQEEEQQRKEEIEAETRRKKAVFISLEKQNATCIQ